jgi:hypothetical protein
MSASQKLASLRHLLAERFPTVPGADGSQVFGAAKLTRVLATGIASLDQVTGGLPLSAITELVCTSPSCGSHLLLDRLLTVTRVNCARVALVDATDSFDPTSYGDDRLAHLLWVRCHGAAEALQVVDLVARDANLGLVVLDLRRIPEGELRRTPATQWYRLQRAVESTDLALLVETPRACVPSAQLRLQFDASHAIGDLEQERDTAAFQLTPLLQRQRLAIAG